ncbi:MAG: carboxypeptidase regulatory-like domain-containing protein, partial [Flavisolibacter sp.]|nr:carboxypeptidase regulatory-like domain-containing protein [Flavisolibacter sp.]
MKKILTLLSLVMVALLTQAQTRIGKVTGTVKDGGQKAIESATISVLKAKDSSVVKIAAANKAGYFEMEDLQLGNYIIMVTAVGHQKGYSKSFELSSANPSVS